MALVRAARKRGDRVAPGAEYGEAEDYQNRARTLKLPDQQFVTFAQRAGIPAHRRAKLATSSLEPMMRDLLDIIRNRHSSRVPFEPKRRVSDADLRQILEAGRWAPTAHNMQNFDIVVVDDQATLAAIGAIRSRPPETFMRENYQQLSFSEEELLRKRTGLLASMFPPSWLTPEAKPDNMVEAQHGVLSSSMQNCPALLIVIYDPRKRAPASDGDMLGIMSLGCVLQNMWLMAEALGVRVQTLSALSAQAAEDDLQRLLEAPSFMKVALALRLGYPQPPPGRYLRVRREVRDFTHHNRYGVHDIG